MESGSKTPLNLDPVPDPDPKHCKIQCIFYPYKKCQHTDSPSELGELELRDMLVLKPVPPNCCWCCWLWWWGGEELLLMVVVLLADIITSFLRERSSGTSWTGPRPEEDGGGGSRRGSTPPSSSSSMLCTSVLMSVEESMFRQAPLDGGGHGGGEVYKVVSDLQEKK